MSGGGLDGASSCHSHSKPAGRHCHDGYYTFRKVLSSHGISERYETDLLHLDFSDATRLTVEAGLADIYSSDRRKKRGEILD